MDFTLIWIQESCAFTGGGFYLKSVFTKKLPTPEKPIQCNKVLFEKCTHKCCSAEKTYNFPPTVIFTNNFPHKVRKSKMRQIVTKKA